MASENPEEPLQQLVTIKPTFSFRAGGPMVVGLPDVEIDDLHVRTIVTRLANNIQDTFTTHWSEQVAQACDTFDLKKPNEAAKMLVDLGWFLPRISYDYLLVQRISRIARHGRVNVDYRVKIWTSIILLYQQAEEWSLAREAAQQLYDLSVSKKRFPSAATALIAIAQGHMYENHPDLARSAYADALRLCGEHELSKESLWAYHNLGLLEWRESNKEQAFIEWCIWQPRPILILIVTSVQRHRVLLHATEEHDGHGRWRLDDAAEARSTREAWSDAQVGNVEGADAIANDQRRPARQYP